MALSEETVLFNEGHFQLAMEAAGAGLWDWNLEDNQIIWSDQCKALFGLPPDASINYARIVSLLHPDDLAHWTGSSAQAISTKKNYSTEYRIIWPEDQSIHWIAARGRCLYNAEGQAIRMIGVALDITAQKLAEQQQRETEVQILDILENISDGFTHLDQNWRYTTLNTKAAELAGQPKEELIGQSFWTVFANLLGTKVETYCRQAMETRQPVHYETHYVYTDHWYDVHIYPTIDQGISLYYSDITERKRSEQERQHLLESERAARLAAEAAQQRSNELIKLLEAEQAHLQALIEQAPAGLIIAEAPHGKITVYNDEAEQILGHPLFPTERITLYGRYGAIHADGTPYKAEEYPLARTLLFKEILRQEKIAYKRGDGRVISISVNAAPILNRQGQMIAAICTFHDITEFQELEQRKDQFISMASHELRTPLTAVKGNLQLAERRLKQLAATPDMQNSSRALSVTEEITLRITRALQQVNTQNRLISDLLDATSIQTDKLRVFLEPCNLVDIVRNVVDNQRLAAGGRTIEFTLPQQKQVPVKADSIRIAQVIGNYLTNALRYSDETKSVTVGLDLTKDSVRVWVRDAGPGLSVEAQQLIWDRFYQVSGGYSNGGQRQTKKNSESGLGLGLYICRALVQLHGGAVGVESTPGEGSLFWFSLPLMQAEA